MSQIHKTVAAIKAVGVYWGVVIVLTLAIPATSHGGTFAAFGPGNFIRETRKPFIETRTFTVLNPDLVYTLRIDNGGLNGEFEKVSSAVITLNGIEVAGPSDFNKKVTVIEKPVMLLTDNELTVELRSQPGSEIMLQIIGIDNDPPVLTITDPPDLSLFDTSPISVSGTVEDDTATTVEVNGAPATMTGWTWTATVPLVEGDNTITATAQDAAGNVGTASIVVTYKTNDRPIADAGDDVNALTSVPMFLNGSGSYDPDDDLITFAWRLVAVPAESAASLADAAQPNPKFIPDVAGNYTFELIANDGEEDSLPDSVTVTAFTGNAPPNARAGKDRHALLESPVLLDGTGSDDPNHDALTFLWSFDEVPPGSIAAISPPNSATPQFTPDVSGMYTITLQVEADSLTDNDTVKVSASQSNVAPNADAGPDKAVQSGQEVILDGTRSFDPDAGPSPLSFSWVFVALPAGSALTNADILDATTLTPRFTIDADGAYILRLYVNDGEKSDADNVLVFVDNTPPIIEILNPADGEFITTTTPDITITFSDADAGIDPESFQAYINGVDSSALFTVTVTSASYQVTTDLPVGDNSITASISDGAGNAASATSNFTIGILRAIPGANPTSGAAPLTVFFTTDGEDPAGTIEVFRWDFESDGSWDTYDTVARDYTHTYSNSGTYTATLYVQSSTGDTATASITITVENNPPEATADVVPSNGPVPLPVQLFGSGTDSDGQIVLYEWDFEGDGTFDWSSTTSGNTSHTYTTVGTYNAVFRITDNEGSTSTAFAATTVVSAGPEGSPTAQGSSTPTTGPAPLTVSFNGSGTDPDGTIALYEWDFTSDGVYDWSSSTTAATTYTYNNPGTFVAAFRVTDNDGKTGVDYLVIEPELQVDLSITEADQTFNPSSGESMGIIASINAPVPASVLLKNDQGDIVKTIPVDTTSIPTPVFSDNMENGMNGWTHGGSNDRWQLGTPTYGPPGAHSGSNSWGTNLTGSYLNNMNSWLLSPQIQINEPSELTFYHYFDSESYYDGGVVEITTDGINFTRIPPQSGYPYQNFGFGGDAYSGSLGGWSRETFNLSSYVGQSIQIRFRFLSDYSVISSGWYIDDVKITTASDNIIWSGNDDNDFPVKDGLYYAILRYQYQGSWHEFDLTNTTGGTRYSFPFGSGCDERSSFSPNISPFEDNFLPLTFRLCKAQAVTAFIGPLWGGQDQTRIRTIVNRQVFPAGTHTIYWDGLDDNGNEAQAPPGDSLITGFWRYDVPENAIAVTGGKPNITAISADPNYFSPFSEKCDANGYGEGVIVGYTLSENVVTVQLRVYSVETGSLLRTSVVNTVQAGDNLFFWDGKNNNGEYVDIGDYRVGILAIDAEGNESMWRYTLVRIDY